MCDSEKSVETYGTLGSIQGWSVYFFWMPMWIEFPKMHLSFDATPAMPFVAHFYGRHNERKSCQNQNEIYGAWLLYVKSQKKWFDCITIYLPRWFSGSQGTNYLMERTSVRSKERACENMYNLNMAQLFSSLRSKRLKSLDDLMVD